MEQLIEKAFNYGFAVVMCLLMFYKLLPRMDKIEEAVKKDSENTEKMTESVDKLEDTISNHLVHNIDKLTTEISRLNNKK